MLAAYLLFLISCFFTIHEHLLKAHIYPHATSGDTPIKEYRRLTVSSIKFVTSRRFQNGVVAV